MEDQLGNSEADTAADLGRRHQSEILINARRRLLKARSYWYPIMTDLHRFMIAIARVSVNHDGKGGTAPYPLVWDQGSRPKVRKLHIRVNVDLASLPGPPGFLNNNSVQVDSGHITSANISAWPYSVGILVRFTSFLGTLHWPSGSVDLGHFGISFLELLILFEQWAGYRLLSEKVTRPHVRADRSILFPSVPVSEGIEIRYGCQFLSSLIRALAELPGGLGRFLPCRLGTHLSRLGHVGWNQCSHGLDSRPLESCQHQCLKALCGVLRYSKGSALELLDGTLKLRYCTDLFLLGFRFVLVTFLVMTFRLGLIVCLFWLGLLPFLVDFTGLLVLLISVMMGSPFWSFSSFLNSGLGTGCLVSWLPGLILELVVLFWFPLCLFQREWKFDMAVGLLAVWSGRWVDFLVG